MRGRAGDLDRERSDMRILVAEDNYLIAMELVVVLEAMGFTVAGPTPSLAAAERLARTSEIDGAVLDLRLSDGESTALAQRLSGQGKPVLLTSGACVPGPLSDLPMLQKPYGLDNLEQAMAAAFNGGRA